MLEIEKFRTVYESHAVDRLDESNPMNYSICILWSRSAVSYGQRTR